MGPSRDPMESPARPGRRERDMAGTDDHLRPAGDSRPPNLHQQDRAATKPGSPRPSNKRTIAVVAVAVLVLMVGGAISGVLIKSSSPAPVTPKQLSKVHVTVPKGQSTKAIQASNKAIMGLQRLNGRQAPNFTLTDQHGQTVSLHQVLEHHAVVLAFMDDRCRDVCPFVAEEIADAYRDLGPSASSIAFLSVNLNAAHNGINWLQSFIATRGNGIASVPSFSYLTGPKTALQKVWNHYGVTVEVKAGKVYHSEAMYFISRGGAMRYEATPFANLHKNGTGWLPPATVTQWGSGIAQYAKAVLR